MTCEPVAVFFDNTNAAFTVPLAFATKLCTGFAPGYSTNCTFSPGVNPVPVAIRVWPGRNVLWFSVRRFEVTAGVAGTTGLVGGPGLPGLPGLPGWPGCPPEPPEPPPEVPDPPIVTPIVPPAPIVGVG